MRKLHLDYARAFGIIAVVWVHVLARVSSDIGNSLEYITKILTSTTFLPILFIVSGALAAKFITKNEVDFLECFKKFFYSILVPFYTLSTLFFIVNMIGSNFIEGLPSPQDMIFSILTFKIDGSMPSGVLWFFVSLFLFSITVSFWYKIVSRNIIVLLFLSIFIKIFISYKVSNIAYFSIDRYTTNLVYYVIGFYFSRSIIEKDFRLLNSIALFLVYIASQNFYTNFYFMNKLVFLIQVTSGCFMAIEMFKKISEHGDNIILRLIQYVGENSIVVFVFHMPCFKIIIPLLFYLNINKTFFGLATWIAFGIILPLMVGRCLAFLPSVYTILFARPPSQRSPFVKNP